MTTALYTSYFEAAAVSNKTLAHNINGDRNTFRRMNIKQILQDQKTDLVDISMVLENYRRQGRDMLSDNKVKLITGAFHIIKFVEEGDFEGQTLAYDECEKVSEQILSKINNDFITYTHDRTYQWPIKGFDPNSVTMNPVNNLFGGWYGIRTEFQIRTSFINNLQLDNDQWINDKRFIP